jgi:hypothetical protein
MDATDAWVAQQSPPLETALNVAGGPVRVRYTHDAMIDLVIANPAISQNAIAAHFGYSVGWVSRIFNSDAFQARLAQRKGDLVDPSIVLTIEEKLKALAGRSLDIVQEKLDQIPSFDNAFKVLELSTKALGYGARQQNVAVQQNFVVAMPSKVENAHAWADSHRAGGLGAGQVVDATVQVV